MPALARRMGRAKPSAIMLVAEKAKRLKAEGRDIISFSIGVPNFLPGEHVYAAARDALAKDSGQYGSNRGPDALVDAFLAHIEALGLTGYSRANVSTGVGAESGGTAAPRGTSENHFSTSRRAWTGSMSPATTSVVLFGPYQLLKNCTTSS